MDAGARPQQPARIFGGSIGQRRTFAIERRKETLEIVDLRQVIVDDVRLRGMTEAR